MGGYNAEEKVDFSKNGWKLLKLLEKVVCLWDFLMQNLALQIKQKKYYIF